MSTITFEYNAVSKLPLFWENPMSWPKVGTYRIVGEFGDKNLYFVTPYSVEVAFDAFEIGEVVEDTPKEVMKMANLCIEKAMEK